MRVILIKGRSGYDALRIFTDGLAEAFAARGYQPAVLDVPAEPDLAAARVQPSSRCMCVKG